MAAKDQILETEDAVFVLNAKGDVVKSCTCSSEVLYIPDGIKEVGVDAVDAPNAKTVVFPESLTRIKTGSFSKCPSLLYVDYSGNGTEAVRLNSTGVAYKVSTVLTEPDAFPHRTSLRIIVGRRFKSNDPQGVLRGCTVECVPEELNDYRSDGPFVYRVYLGWHEKSDFRLVAYTDDKAECVEILDGVALLEEGCFAGLTNLREVVFPSTVRVVKAGAFRGCSALSVCELPDLLDQVDISAFEGCSSLDVRYPWFASLRKVDADTSHGNGPVAEGDLMKWEIPQGLRSLTFDERGLYRIENGVIVEKEEMPEAGFLELVDNKDYMCTAAARIVNDQDALAKLACTEWRNTVLRNPSCPSSVMEEAARTESFWLWTTLGENPNTSVAALEIMAYRDDPEIVEVAASHPNCPAYLLGELAHDDDPKVRRAVGRNPNCPESVMRFLAEASTLEPRMGVAANPNCPTDLLEKLAEDCSGKVRSQVVANQSVPYEWLTRFDDDSSPYVQGELYARWKAHEKAIKDAEKAAKAAEKAAAKAAAKAAKAAKAAAKAAKAKK